MNIFWLSPTPSHPQNAGNRSRIFSLAKFFQNQGHRITFVYFAQEGNDPQSIAGMKAEWDDFYLIPVSGGERQKSQGDLWGVDDWYEETITEHIVNLLRQKSFDIVFCEYIFQSKVLELFPAQCVKIIDTHDRFGGRADLLKRNNIEPEFFYTTSEQEAIALNRADLIIAIQEKEAKYYTSITSKKVVVLNHVIEETEWQWSPPQLTTKKRRLRIGYCGSENLLNRTSINQFLDIYYQNHKLIANSELIFAGAICQHLNIPQEVNATLMGNITQITDFYRVVDIAINPMVDGTGLKIKTVEAINFGVPIFSTVSGSEGLPVTADFHLLENSQKLPSHLWNVCQQDQLLEIYQESLLVKNKYNFLLEKQLDKIIENIQNIINLRRHQNKIIFTDTSFWEGEKVKQARIISFGNQLNKNGHKLVQEVGSDLVDTKELSESQSVEFYLEQAQAYYNQGEWKQVIATCQSLLDFNPESFEAYQLWGKTLQAQGKHLEAINCYGKAKVIKQKNQPVLGIELGQAKQALDVVNQIALEHFLVTKTKINFPEVEHPTISIILVLYNRAELTLSCLSSIVRNSFTSLELIIVDNKSTDKTRTLLELVAGAKIIFNEENLHFLLACNQASKVATGDYLLFLNNDAQILGDSLEHAVQTIQSSPDIGAVGGKIIYPDGTLQEAGSIIWQDGTCGGYGRGDSPTAPQYMFRRSVDYCSGAFLLTPRQLFVEMGGFDESYQPAYYEETDYCVRLWRLGKKVIYEPNVAILHYEFASSSNSSFSDDAICLQPRLCVIALMEQNHAKFMDKHGDWLSNKYPPDLSNSLFARSARDNRQRILLIADRVFDDSQGLQIIEDLVKLDCFVTVYFLNISEEQDWHNTYAQIPREVEVMGGYGWSRLAEFLTARREYYHLVLVRNHQSLEQLNNILAKENLLGKTKIIDDSEELSINYIQN